MRIVQFRVEGRVQGVGFRAFTVRTGVELGLAGFVRNCRDGSVEGRVGGPDDAVSSFLEAIGQGPRAASVDRVVTRPAQPRSLPRPFQVQPDSPTPLD